MRIAFPTLDRSLASPRPAWALALGCALFAVLTAVGASAGFRLPFSPVPVTLQTLAVVLSGAVLGPFWGAASQLLYLGAGVLGLPVFAEGAAGPAVLLGPTGGYLTGFVVVAWLAGCLVRPGASWLRLAIGITVAQLSVFLFGIPQLVLVAGFSPKAAIAAGFTPFLPGLVWKTVAAVLALRSPRLAGWFRS